MSFKHMVAAITLGAAALAVGKPHSVPSGYDPLNFNPHPTEIYEVTLTVYNAPGPLKPNDGFMGYTATFPNAFRPVWGRGVTAQL